MTKCINTPIRLSKNAVAIVHMFTRHNDIGEVYMMDDEQYEEESYNCYEESANEFINQLSDQYCMAFLQALNKRIEKELDEWEKEKMKLNNND